MRHFTVYLNINLKKEREIRIALMFRYVVF